MNNATYITKIVRSEIEEGYVRDKLCYFIEYYEFAFDQMENGTLEWYPLNSHAILRMLEDEMKNYPNSRNLHFFKKVLNRVKGRDYVCHKKYNFLIEQLLQLILSDEAYALQICRELLERMEQGKYAKNLCIRMEEVLFDDQSLECRKEEIRYLTISLLIEQKIYGYSTKKIQNLLKELFSEWESVQGIIYTDYPFIPDFETENRSQCIKEYMEKLKVRDRIHDMSRIFEQQTTKFVFVCGISGMKGEMLDLEIGRAKIYNAEYSPKFDFEGSDYRDEDFTPYKIAGSIHAAVELDCMDDENFKKEAKKEIEKAIDIICCYSQIQVPININMSKYVVLNANHQAFKTGAGIDYNIHRDLRGLDYNGSNLKDLQEIYQKYTGAVLEVENDLALAIQNSARWFRKGEESVREEDKLLNDWICMESLFPDELELPKEIQDQPDSRKSKFGDIYSLIPTMILRKRLFAYFWDCFSLCNNLYLNNRKEKDDNPFPISEELAKNCGFKAEGQLNLLPFLESLEKMINQIPNGVIKDYLQEVQDYVSGKREISKLIAKITDECKEQLLMGYRFRNIIVHNAKSNMDFIEYYEEQLRGVARDVIRLVIGVHEEHAKWDMAELLLRKNIENREMIEELKSQNLIDWMKEKG